MREPRSAGPRRAAAWTKIVLCVGAAAPLLGLAGCAFHHVEWPESEQRTYVDFESDPNRWGGHYYESAEDSDD